MSVSTHVLDSTTGRPAVGVPVTLSRRDEDEWVAVAADRTDDNGRVPDLAADLTDGMYRLRFDTEAYFGDTGFYPEVVVTFRVTGESADYHVPLLLSPFAFSTYRGS